MVEEREDRDGETVEMMPFKNVDLAKGEAVEAVREMFET